MEKKYKIIVALGVVALIALALFYAPINTAEYPDPAYENATSTSS